jgi:hypothetical protein
LKTTLRRLSWPTRKPCLTRPHSPDGPLPVLSVPSGPPRRHLMSANWISGWYALVLGLSLTKMTLIRGRLLSPTRPTSRRCWKCMSRYSR